jgi:capsule polysaccharide export protein KpsC/LpsZ
MSWARSTSAKPLCWPLKLESSFNITKTPRSFLTYNNREKKRRQQGFDLVQAVHASEYASLPRPIDPKTKKPIEPAHKFEVTIEGDSLSQRKSVVRFWLARGLS